MWSISKNFLLETIFFLGFPYPGEEQTSVTCLNTFGPRIHLNIIKQTCYYKCRYVRICVNSRGCLKILHQNNQGGERSSLEIISRPESIKVLYARTRTLWIVSYLEECLWAYKVCTDILPHEGNCNKLLHNILRRSPFNFKCMQIIVFKDSTFLRRVVWWPNISCFFKMLT